MPCPNSSRQRSVTIAFRATPEERDRIDQLVAMSGMLKQDYIMAKLEDAEICVTPSVRVYKGMKDAAKAIYLELRRIHSAAELDPEMRSVMRSLAAMLQDLGCYDSRKVSKGVSEAADMMNLSRE